MNVQIKPLTWEDQSDDVVTFHVTRNQIGMSYVVTVENLMTFVHSGSREVARFPSLAIDKAKAAAQADYETRILSALISSPGKDGGQEVEAVSDRREPCPHCKGEGCQTGDPEGAPLEACDYCNGSGKKISTQPASTALVEADIPIELVLSALDDHKAKSARNIVSGSDFGSGFRAGYLAALSVPAAAVVGEPVAWTTEANLESAAYDPELALTMWGKPTGKKPVALYREPIAAPSAPDGWQSIETAPRDGTVILARYQWGGESRFLVIRLSNMNNWWVTDHDGLIKHDEEKVSIRNYNFTHWRPLPAPPALGGKHD